MDEIDLDDALSERASEIYDCFKKHMDSQLKQYTLKHWRALLGESKVGEVRISLPHYEFEQFTSLSPKYVFKDDYFQHIE